MRRLTICLTLIALAYLSAATAANSSRLPQQECPVITLETRSRTICIPDEATFTAHVTGVGQNSQLTYFWTVSTGKIISGQGTQTITIATADAHPDAFFEGIKGTVEIGGLAGAVAGCLRTASYWVRPIVCDHSTKLDDFGKLSLEDEQSRLDNFAIMLEKEDISQGLIVGYAGGGATPDEIKARLERAKNYLINERGVWPTRLEILEGGQREESTIELWIRPPKAPPFNPTPAAVSGEEQILNVSPRSGTP